MLKLTTVSEILPGFYLPLLVCQNIFHAISIWVYVVVVYKVNDIEVSDWRIWEKYYEVSRARIGLLWSLLPVFHILFYTRLRGVCWYQSYVINFFSFIWGEMSLFIVEN